MDWLGVPAIALVLGTLVMSGSARNPDSGWRVHQGESPISPVKLFGKRQQLDGASQNFNWTLVGATPIVISFCSLNAYFYIAPAIRKSHLDTVLWEF